MTTARLYMSYARSTLDGNAPAHSLDDFQRRKGRKRTPGAQRDKDWRAPIKEILKDRVNIEVLRQHELDRAHEEALRRKLGLQVIDIARPALAPLHSAAFRRSVPGMPGSPIINEEGQAIAVVCTGTGNENRSEDGPHARLMHSLPLWMTDRTPEGPLRRPP
jgi:hypothetical protein